MPPEHEPRAATPPSARQRRPDPRSASWQALGTTAVVRVTDPRRLAAARALVAAILAEVDLACSRFRPDSELSRLNAAAGRYVPVSTLFLQALDAALQAARLTDGDLDPTIGNALVLAGYDASFEQVAARAERQGAFGGRLGGSEAAEQIPPRQSATHGAPALRAQAADWRSISIARSRRLVKVPLGVRLDFGATAKSLAADIAAAEAHSRLGCGVLVSLGGDIATAGDAPIGGWRIHVTDDHRAGAEAPGQTIAIGGGGLATSSTTVRRWRKDGRQMHHLIDPRAGRPVDGPWRTASVAAACCLDANIAASTAIIRGESAPGWLADQGLPARLVAEDGSVNRIAGWPAPVGDLDAEVGSRR